jgi:pimeloyl-ACP methyl ester carboxylesterase
MPLRRYIERGSGPAVVFSHGSMMTHAMFEPQIDCLAREYRVIAYDNRTWFQPHNPHTLDDLVEDCRSLLDDLNVTKCVLFGMSMGGHMAIPFALKYPERLRGLVLMGAGAAAFPPDIRNLTGESFGQLDIDGTVPRAWAERTAQVVFGKTTFATNRALIDHWVDRWTEAPARVVYRQGMSWIYKEDLSDRMKELKIPVQIIHGEEETAYLMDWVLPMLEVLPDSALARIPGAGHFANLENPKAVNIALSDFLRRIGV